MKFFELPQVAQSAACEVLKSNIGSFVTNSADVEPALQLARKLNAIFTELYFPAGKDGGKSPDEAYKELKDASRKLAMQVTNITDFSHLSSDPKLQQSTFEMPCNGDDSMHELKEESRKLSTNTMALINYHDLAVKDPQCREPYQILQSRAQESVLRVRAILERCHQPDFSS